MYVYIHAYVYVQMYCMYISLIFKYNLILPRKDSNLRFIKK